MKKPDLPGSPPPGLSRRAFLGGAAAATALVTLEAQAQAPSTPAAPTPPAATPRRFELEEATVAELQAAMQAGQHTAHGLAERYLARIQELDRQGALPLRSVIELNPDALAIAAALDRERKEKGPRGPLHGIPVLLKDNIATADRMQTTAGSLALVGAVPRRDAFIVERLRAAGAVILGKTNLSEWANFRSTRSSSGWSARGGQTRNPYVLDRSPCGSSSGTGAAVSANLGAVGVGTETDGSIVCPSSLCGLVGLKPTVGLVSRHGIVPISASQDTAGPMARTVTDAAILLSALAGEDPADPATAASRGRALADYAEGLRPDALKGARLGVARKLFGFHGEVDKVMAEALAALKDAGAILVDPADIATEKQLGDPEFQVLLYEFKAGLAEYLATRPEQPHRSLADLIAFNAANAAREMPYFGQELFELAERKGPLTSPGYRKARQLCRRLARTEGIDATLARHKLDAILAPTGGPAWTIDLVNGDHFGGGSSTAAAVAGYPNVTVPAGMVHGLPVGLSFIGFRWSEPRLLRLAYAFEQATRARRAPAFRPSL